MRIVEEWCFFCQKTTKQTAVAESWLDVSGYNIFVSYWRKCLECGNKTIDKMKEISGEDLE